MNIAIERTGYVDLSINTLLPQHHKVTPVDAIGTRYDTCLSDVENKIIQDIYSGGTKLCWNII